MTIVEPVYANRETVKRALDIKETALANDQIDRLLQSASRSIDGDLKRKFYPRVMTFEIDWPNSQSPTPWRLWLNDKELVSVTELRSGGVVIGPGGFITYPDDGPPFNRIEIDTSTNSSFTTGSTHQKAISITGVFGYTLNLQALGGLVGAIDADDTTVVIGNGSLVGVGDLLVIESEYLQVTGRTWLDSTQTLQSPALTASAANTSLNVTTGSAFHAGETILLDSEKMLITDVSGNSLSVRRAYDGSVLASHSGSTIYVSRNLTVTRGVNGTTGASHLISTPVSRWVPPSLITQLCIAETINALQQESSAYARVVGTGETAIEARGVGLADLRKRACTTHGRQMRTRAV